MENRTSTANSTPSPVSSSTHYCGRECGLAANASLNITAYNACSAQAGVLTAQRSGHWCGVPLAGHLTGERNFRPRYRTQLVYRRLTSHFYGANYIAFTKQTLLSTAAISLDEPRTIEHCDHWAKRRKRSHDRAFLTLKTPSK